MPHSTEETTPIPVLILPLPHKPPQLHITSDTILSVKAAAVIIAQAAVDTITNTKSHAWEAAVAAAK